MGLDVIGPINPPSYRGKQYILAATNYFSKWTEAVTLRSVKEKDVVNFIRHVIIYLHGILKKIVTDNGTPFKNRGMEKLCQKFNIRHSFSTPYYPPSNGLAEASNKTIVKILKKMVTGNKRDWDEKLQEALWAYRTTHRTATGATPYSLIYGMEAVIPIEIQVASLRVAVHQSITEDENARIKLEELDLLDEKCLAAQQRLQSYQARILPAFDKQVKYRSFKKGDMVLMLKRPIVVTRRTGGKFEPKWDGPYVVKEVYSQIKMDRVSVYRSMLASSKDTTPEKRYADFDSEYYRHNDSISKGGKEE